MKTNRKIMRKYHSQPTGRVEVVTQNNTLHCCYLKYFWTFMINGRKNGNLSVWQSYKTTYDISKMDACECFLICSVINVLLSLVKQKHLVKWETRASKITLFTFHLHSFERNTIYWIGAGVDPEVYLIAIYSDRATSNMIK